MISPPPTARRDREEHHEADVLVIGAGVGGCAFAHALADQGRSVIVLERSLRQPDRIVGELLQPGGVRALEQLGLRDCLEGIDAVRVKGYNVIYYGNEVRIPYSDPVGKTGEHSLGTGADDEKIEEKSMERRRDEDSGTVPNIDEKTVDTRENITKQKSNKPDPPEGRSFHHGRFIQRLRQRILSHPNINVVEATATGLVRNAYSQQVVGVEATVAGNPDAFFASLTVIADGYASKFRSTLRPSDRPVVRSRFWALELIDVPLPVPYAGNVVLGDSAPVLLYQIGTHETRALIDIPNDTPTARPAVGGVRAHLRNVVLPSLPPAVQPAFAAALEPSAPAPRSMPNSFLPATANRTRGLLTLGDALNIRHPLTGGGMTVALCDAVLLSRLLSPDACPSLADTHAVTALTRSFHWHRKPLASTINILAQALYALFAATAPTTDPNPSKPLTRSTAFTPLRALQCGCFAYFRLGGVCISGPVSLLAGIRRHPLLLLYHFFAVALYSMLVFVAQGGRALTAPWRLLLCPTVLLQACVVIGPYLAAEMRI